MSAKTDWGFTQGVRIEDLEDVLEIGRARQEEVAEPRSPLDVVRREFDVRREEP